jgi:hypothetical protein
MDERNAYRGSGVKGYGSREYRDESVTGTKYIVDKKSGYKQIL